MTKCEHGAELRRPGPRVPARWGSFATEICTKCLYWRTTAHVPGRWTEPLELVRRLIEDDDE